MMRSTSTPQSANNKHKHFKSTTQLTKNHKKGFRCTWFRLVHTVVNCAHLKLCSMIFVKIRIRNKTLTWIIFCSGWDNTMMDCKKNKRARIQMFTVPAAISKISLIRNKDGVGTSSLKRNLCCFLRCWVDYLMTAVVLWWVCCLVSRYLIGWYRPWQATIPYQEFEQNWQMSRRIRCPCYEYW